MPGKRRRSSEERRQQIVSVTLDLVAEYGVRGTTLARIAAAIGVTTPALYAHFSGRREILLAALQVLFEHRTEFHRQPADGDALERLRDIARGHTQLVETPDDRSMSALFEFIVAPQEEGLRETVGAMHLILVEDIAEIVRRGQRECVIRENADPEQTAWMIVSRAWAEDITQLMGVRESWSEKRSNVMLDLILDAIAVVPVSG